MDDNTIEIISKVANPNKTKIQKVKDLFRDFFATLIWSYVLLGVFLFDLDLFFSNLFGSGFEWAIKFKFFILIIFLSILWFFAKTSKMVGWFFYFAFFPFIVIFWKVPFFIYKRRSWNFAFLVVNSLMSYFSQCKFNFIVTSLYLISFFLIFDFSNRFVLLFSILCLMILICLTYFEIFKNIFKPSKVFEVYLKFFKGITSSSLTACKMESNIKDLPVERLDEKQVQKRVSSLQTIVLYNRLCFYFAKKMKNFQESGLNVVSYTLNVFFMILLTVFSFAVANFALYKIDSGNYSCAASPHFFDFIWYSFNRLFFQSIPEINPIAPYSKILCMFEQILNVAIVVILIALLYSFKNQKESEEINRIVENLKIEGKFFEKFVFDEFRVKSIEDAMAELDKAKASLIRFLYSLSAGL